MFSYILLIIIAIVLLGVIRASKHEHQVKRRPREPKLGLAPAEQAPVSADNLLAYDVEHRLGKFPGPQDSTSEAVMSFPHRGKVKTLGKKIEIQLVVIHLLIEEGRPPYGGYELLQTFLMAGLRYGKKGIFHRHEDMTGKGEVLFSLAQAMEPGVFDLQKMGTFTTPGLVLFMLTEKVKSPSAVLNMMLNTAKDLQKELGGQLYDEKKQPLNEEKVQYWRCCLEE